MTARHHAHHGHAHGARANERRVVWALLLTGAFTVVEIVGGIVSGSLALLADAGHMLSDVAALALTWGAFRLGRRPAGPKHSYGHSRFEVLAAFVNGLAFIALTVWIAIEAVRRLLEPVEILSGTMLLIATLGLAANLASFAILRGGGDTLNLRGAALHVLGDMLGSVAAILAALIIRFTGWSPADPLLSIVIALLILRSAWTLVNEAGHVLLEGVPEDIDIARLTEQLRSVPQLADIHHVHAWSLTAERPLLTLHASLAEGADPAEALRQAKAVIARAGIDHSVIQLEAGPCPDDRLAPAEGRAAPG